MAVFLATAAAVLIADQWTKSWVLRSIGDDERRHVFGPLHLVKRFNTGMAFSIGDGAAWTQWLVRAGVVALLAWTAITLRRASTTPRFAALLALLAAGGVGNQIDRIFRTGNPVRRSVVDFLDVGFWPVFNVADSALSTACVLLIIRSFRAPKLHHDQSERDVTKHDATERDVTS